jgi:3-isopropylmalate/(R)-2-methylmalate dehydratase small subunit
MFEKPQEGKAWVFGDNIDTDAIYPGRFLHIINPDEMAEHAFAFIKPEFNKEVKSGDIIIAGRNFGCGSSREHAVHCLKNSGVGAVIALSFARIFYRNAVNCALPVFTFDTTENDPVKIFGSVFGGDKVELDLEVNSIKVISSGKLLKIEPLPEHLQKIISAGGLIEHLKAEKTK